MGVNTNAQIYGIYSPTKKLYPIRANPSGSIDVALQDQTTPSFYMRFLVEQGSGVLSVPTVIDSRSVTLDSVTNIISGTYLELFENGGIGYRWLQAQVIVVNSGTGVLTLDQPLDYVYASGVDGAKVYFGTDNLAVSGTAETPIVARVWNKGLGASWDLSVLNVHVEGTTSMADGEFGSIPALTYGMQTRFVSESGTFPYFNGYNFKTNHDLIGVADRWDYSEKAGGGTNYALNIDKHIGGQGNLGAVVRLDHTTNDRVEVLIQDNLEALTTVHVNVEGSVVEP